MRAGGTFSQKMHRMMEFYTRDEIDYFVEQTYNNNLDPVKAMTWLDMQTRVNYVTGVNTDPTIEKMTLEYLIEEGLNP